MIRLSVSDLESIRYWKDGEDGTIEDLQRKLRHQEPPTDAMEAGAAFAKFFERTRTGEIGTVVESGWTFDFSDLDMELPISPVRELKAEVVLDTPSGLVTLVGKVDGLNGTTVVDQKLTQRFDAERYLDSLQWRAYLMMFNANKFVYDVFVGKYKARTVGIDEYHRLAFWTYPDLADDVQVAVEEAADLITTYCPELVK